MSARLLLDTHVVIWWRTRDHRLQEAARTAITHAAEVYVSAASAWEVAIKVATGKLRLDADFEAGVLESRFSTLPITFAHARQAGILPPHHRDPFDRMLLAQAALERLTLVTHDERLRAYGAAIIWT